MCPTIGNVVVALNWCLNIQATSMDDLVSKLSSRWVKITATPCLKFWTITFHFQCNSRYEAEVCASERHCTWIRTDTVSRNWSGARLVSQFLRNPPSIRRQHTSISILSASLVHAFLVNHMVRPPSLLFFFLTSDEFPLTFESQSCGGCPCFFGSDEQPKKKRAWTAVHVLLSTKCSYLKAAIIKQYDTVVAYL